MPPLHADPTTTKVWFVTGTSTGLGRALAEEVIADGDRLVATARDAGTLDDLVAQAPDRVRALPLDVTDPTAVRLAVDAALKDFGRIDVLVNNAGYALRGALEELSETELRRQFDTNVFGALDVTRAVLPAMRAQRSGCIVQMSSVGGVLATLGGTAYAGTKFALEGLSEGLAAEVAHLGIHVLIVEPGPFRTDFTGRSVRWADPIDDYRSVLDPAKQQFLAMHGTQPGDPARAARAVITATRMEKPPLRLPLGANAIDRIRERLQRRLREVDEVEALGRPTDFD
ncbi:SDR family NAD(P)-dependent oxidoreductase [Streptomyces sp. ISL-22]|uniref:oxidoreductase n=1 Tax=unclassified Streptomyces TaxID=2593676 RepID=UPI001BEC8019|nr:MULTISPECIES: oxidoreductase [unclassified Streptomyces]MBT2419307.1 SDR family NAD(P)-dependent oxidoreductase [Streptomyces sp. ISL-24]MBT2436803.1 SDR family NAD(P)-dependent oxidoreductase [Streptomyces sp. ISL-22]